MLVVLTNASDWLFFFHLSVLQCSADLTCFIRFKNFDVYTTQNYRHKYKAPTDFCFVLKVTLRSTPLTSNHYLHYFNRNSGLSNRLVISEIC